MIFCGGGGGGGGGGGVKNISIQRPSCHPPETYLDILHGLCMQHPMDSEEEKSLPTKCISRTVYS